MTIFSSDPDEDDIKRILESMWEKTSRSDGDATSGFGRGRGIDIDLGSNGRSRSRADSGVEHVNVTDVEPPQNGISHDWPNGDGGALGDGAFSDGDTSRRRLIDTLHDVDVGERAAGGSPSNSTRDSPDGQGQDPRDVHQQLSSLNYQEDGRVVAASETEMQSQSGQHPHDPIEYANGNSHDVGGERDIQKDENRFELEGDPLLDGRVEGPTGGAADDGLGAHADQHGGGHGSMTGSHVEQTEGSGKREMASFFDSRMKSMGGGGGAPRPAGAPAVSAPPPTQRQPVAPAPSSASAPASPASASMVAASQGAPSAGGSPDSAAELMRPVLRQWLGENMPKIVESALQIEAAASTVPDDTKKTDK